LQKQYGKQTQIAAAKAAQASQAAESTRTGPVPPFAEAGAVRPPSVPLTERRESEDKYWQAQVRIA